VKKIHFKTPSGSNYSVFWRKPDKRYGGVPGICFHPEDKDPRIYIEPRLLDRRRLAVLIEEITHAFFFEKNEKDARKFAATLTKLIYFDGWRRVKKTK
jgi:hypothetical protein